MSSSYSFGETMIEYGRWHYGRGLHELFGIAGNFLHFILHFFSITLLLKTLFHPLRRISEGYSKGFDLGAFFSSLVVNTLMRLVGAIVRISIIVVGLTVFLLVGFGLIAVIFFWLVFPLAIIIFLIAAFSLILKSI